MNRACAVAFALVLACAGFAAADQKSAADSLIDGLGTDPLIKL